MISPDFDPLAQLNELTITQHQQAELTTVITGHLNQQAIMLNQMIQQFNELNRKLCIQANTITELELMVAELKIKDLKDDNN